MFTQASAQWTDVRYLTSLPAFSPPTTSPGGRVWLLANDHPATVNPARSSPPLSAVFRSPFVLPEKGENVTSYLKCSPTFEMQPQKINLTAEMISIIEDHRWNDLQLLTANASLTAEILLVFLGSSQCRSPRPWDHNSNPLKEMRMSACTRNLPLNQFHPTVKFYLLRAGL